MAWQRIVMHRFGGPEVLESETLDALPAPGPGELRIKVEAAGTGFTDTFIRRGRYPDVKGNFPIVPGYELVGTIDALGGGVDGFSVGQCVADLCVTGGYAQYAVRPAADVVAVPEGLDPAIAVTIPLAYLTAYQMLRRCCNLQAGARILVIGASGTVGTALLDLARALGLVAIGTASARNLDVVRGHGAVAIDYARGDFVAEVQALGRVDAAFDAIGGAHFARSFACLKPGGRLIGYGAQTMAAGGESLLAAGLGLARLSLWGALPGLFGGRSAQFYSITARRKTQGAEFRADMAALFAMAKAGEIAPVVVERLGLGEARAVHARIEGGGLGGKIVLLPWGV